MFPQLNRKKYCFIPCPEGAPCECRASMHLNLDELIKSPDTFLDHEILPKNEQDAHECDATKAT